MQVTAITQSQAYTAAGTLARYLSQFRLNTWEAEVARDKEMARIFRLILSDLDHTDGAGIMLDACSDTEAACADTVERLSEQEAA